MSPGRLGPVEIGAREIYDAVMATQAAVSGLAEQMRDATRHVADHEYRLRDVERARWPLPALSIVVALAALAASLAPVLIKG